MESRPQNLGFPMDTTFFKAYPYVASRRIILNLPIGGFGLANVAESGRPRKPVTASEEGIKFNISSVERNVFYQVEYDGEKYAVRVTEDGILERYVVE